MRNPCSRSSAVVGLILCVAEESSDHVQLRQILHINSPAQLGRQFPTLPARRKTMSVTSSARFDLPPRAPTDEYHVVLKSNSRFDRLLRKDDFLDEGVAAVFGLAGEQAELLSLSFQAEKFTPAQIASWLAERRFTLPV